MEWLGLLFLDSVGPAAWRNRWLKSAEVPLAGRANRKRLNFLPGVFLKLSAIGPEGPSAYVHRSKL